jgi:hypothetical protein
MKERKIVKKLLSSFLHFQLPQSVLSVDHISIGPGGRKIKIEHF